MAQFTLLAGLFLLFITLSGATKPNTQTEMLGMISGNTYCGGRQIGGILQNTSLTTLTTSGSLVTYAGVTTDSLASPGTYFSCSDASAFCTAGNSTHYVQVSWTTATYANMYSVLVRSASVRSMGLVSTTQCTTNPPPSNTTTPTQTSSGAPPVGPTMIFFVAMMIFSYFVINF